MVARLADGAIDAVGAALQGEFAFCAGVVGGVEVIG